jgi:hypothetical protein
MVPLLYLALITVAALAVTKFHPPTSCRVAPPATCYDLMPCGPARRSDPNESGVGGQGFKGFKSVRIDIYLEQI